ncbi:hypothetical protein WV31_10050 [Magnetospirillum sp. ME-1]|uniref:hypothetical protein n=1 Tax=Magnetospirillum sp. ME-1 TaxID=1639348 RepID=UPI000A179A37|nr:hypothetical protein [Magnetospirillum sp. ME-1]ARJ65969.1 hypothetical protein WV31_10050 [Magnetospirillum sp. ME-1]
MPDQAYSALMTAARLVVEDADTTGCSEDLTVTSASAITALENALAGMDSLMGAAAPLLREALAEMTDLLCGIDESEGFAILRRHALRHPESRKSKAYLALHERISAIDDKARKALAAAEDPARVSAGAPLPPITGYEETLSRVAAIGGVFNLRSPLPNDYCATPYAASLLDCRIARWIDASVRWDSIDLGLDAVAERVWQEVRTRRPDGFGEEELLGNPSLVDELLHGWRIA